MARAEYTAVLHVRYTHLGLAATTAGLASLDPCVADLLVILHLGAAAIRLTTASCFATAGRGRATGGFATTIGSSTTRGLTTTGITTHPVTKTKTLRTKAERQNDRPKKNVPFHNFQSPYQKQIVYFASDSASCSPALFNEFSNVTLANVTLARKTGA
jgi:hypothetical protein